jgi:hypothetical protein
MTGYQCSRFTASSLGVFLTAFVPVASRPACGLEIQDV